MSPPTWVQVNAFGEALYKIVTELLNVARSLSRVRSKLARRLARPGAKLLAVVGPAIEALEKAARTDRANRRRDLDCLPTPCGALSRS